MGATIASVIAEASVTAFQLYCVREDIDIKKEILNLKDDGYSNKDIVKILKNNFDISKNEAYELVLNLENEEEK